MNEDRYFMELALREAEAAYAEGEVPVGAVLVDGEGRVLARTRNRREGLQDPTAHAELLALREGSVLAGSWRLTGTTLYVTKEPCIMCAGTMVNARLGRLVYGCGDTKAGALTLFGILEDRRLNHRVEVAGGLLAEESAALLRRFFCERR